MTKASCFSFCPVTPRVPKISRSAGRAARDSTRNPLRGTEQGFPAAGAEGSVVLPDTSLLRTWSASHWVLRAPFTCGTPSNARSPKVGLPLKVAAGLVETPGGRFMHIATATFEGGTTRKPYPTTHLENVNRVPERLTINASMGAPLKTRPPRGSGATLGECAQCRGRA